MYIRKKLKVFLDDCRDAPWGWIRTVTVEDTVRLLETGLVEELSLDHDLGATDPSHDGYAVLNWIEEMVHTEDEFVLPTLNIHSANPPAVKRMNEAVKSIKMYDELKQVRLQTNREGTV